MSSIFSLPDSVKSGSYHPKDVSILLRHVEIEPTSVDEKELLIQTQQRHYSEMISQEYAPSSIHQQLFTRAVDQNGARMARDVQSLALALNNHNKSGAVVLVSLVRAGLPLGVLLRRALAELGRDVFHYGVSVVRDRGLDQVAIEAIIAAHGADGIVFVDGWTGKGAISDELHRSLQADCRFPSNPRLVVLADPCGKAWLSASSEDWIIPSGILGATVSGLVSRSIWPTDGGLHGCVMYEHLRTHDVTQAFVETIDSHRKALLDVGPARPWTPKEVHNLQTSALAVIEGLAKRLSITNLNRIKPGIAEATRAVLRRVPEQVFIRSRQDMDVQLLVHLTERAGISVTEAGDILGPYRAVTIIRGVRP